MDLDQDGWSSLVTIGDRLQWRYAGSSNNPCRRRSAQNSWRDARAALDRVSALSLQSHEAADRLSLWAV